MAHAEDVLGAVPVASLEGSVDEGVSVIVDVGENSILVLQIAVAAVALGGHPCKQKLIRAWGERWTYWSCRGRR